MAALFQDAHGITGHGLGLFELLLSYKDLSASIINLGDAYFVPNIAPETPRLYQICVSLLEAREFAKDVTNVVLHVSPKDDVAS